MTEKILSSRAAAKSAIVLDPVDKALLRALQENGRATNSELAQRVHVSESSCVRRVKKLEQAGVIERFTAKLNLGALGLPSTVFVTIGLVQQSQEALTQFEAAVSAIPEVLECWLLAGTSDYMLKVAIADADHLERLHAMKLTRLPGVARVTSSLAIRRITNRSDIFAFRL